VVVVVGVVVVFIVVVVVAVEGGRESEIVGRTLRELGGLACARRRTANNARRHTRTAVIIPDKTRSRFLV